ncbi:MAG: FAD-dependent thymidylate synthase [Drouetiella hepatica Uher 2000/2452]|jgi:thymidylate synthase (FAD)|uniref:FAD-dependent thymidylate synthase n=1 Tax=Drouetiella hepatica Uher 2000/2452 TaxID=904376 RepID=A0A951UNI1_9CYAN|nr:FAD-dependent thymidylate synthase [Drouetiella hepatica Uher 2000/2452]
MDRFFTVEVLSQSANPQQLIYAAMHQDYAEGFVWAERDRFPDEDKAGDLVVRNLLSGNRGHYGPLEHPQIVLNCGFFPHSTMQQIRTHRVGISFDVQSFRYTGSRITDVVEGKRDIEEVFYLRPLGAYTDRQGKRYEYTEEIRQQDVEWCLAACKRYQERIHQGFSEEHARGIIPFDVRQHWVMSANVRSLMHLLDLRWKLDAQLEAQQLCELIWNSFEKWTPAIAQWYESNRAKKARLAP